MPSSAGRSSVPSPSSRRGWHIARSSTRHGCGPRTLGDDILRLTPSQTKALTEELYAVLRRYRSAPPPAEDGETAALVAAYLQVFPFERLEDLDR